MSIFSARRLHGIRRLTAVITTVTVATTLGIGTAPATAQLAEHTWRGIDGEPLPFQTDEEILEFLRNAEIVSAEEIVTGVTRPYRVVLRHDGVEIQGAFRYVDERQALALYAANRGERRFFRDAGLFEIAAYELGRLLGIEHIPPVVERKYDRMEGSLQIWVEQTMTESERVSQGLFDPATQRWNKQLNVMNVFDALVANIDRNRGNILIDDHWRLWFIDHTRAFRGSSDIDTTELRSIERRFWHGLRGLDAEAVTERVGPYLTKRELSGLLNRAEKLVQHFERLIREQGEAQVLYDY